jgi:hypothetical protein
MRILCGRQRQALTATDTKNRTEYLTAPTAFSAPDLLADLANLGQRAEPVLVKRSARHYVSAAAVLAVPNSACGSSSPASLLFGSDDSRRANEAR